MKGTSDKSTSRDHQKNKDPENDRVKTGKMRLIPEVVIERRGAPKVKESERVVEKVVEKPSQEENVPEWRRNAPKIVSNSDRQELPYRDVPSVVPGNLDQRRTFDRQVRFELGKDRQEPAFKRKAPVEESTSLTEVASAVLNQPITLTLEELAGISPAVRENLRSQFTRKRLVRDSFAVEALPGNPFEEEESEDEEEASRAEPKVELPLATVTVNLVQGIGVPIGGLIVSDPLSQYLETVDEDERKRVFVAKDTESLRAVWPEINNSGKDECIVDWGSQIVAMSKDVAINLGISWNPAFRINMQSANGQVELSEGLAKNVPFRFGEVTAYLQVHVLQGVAYRVLLGRPFEVLTLTKTEALENGGQLLTITDPNTGTKVVVPTCERGKGPSDKKVKEETSTNSAGFQ